MTRETIFGQLPTAAEFHLSGERVTYRKVAAGRQEALVAYDPSGRTTGTTTRFGEEKPVVQGPANHRFAPTMQPKNCGRCGSDNTTMIVGANGACVYCSDCNRVTSIAA